MSEQQSLTAFYAGWDAYQRLLASAVAPLTAAQLDIQAAPHLRTVRVNLAHIIAARVWWFHFIMHEGSSDIAPLVEWDDDGQPAWTADQLVDGLNRSWELVANTLARWTPADLDQSFKHPRRDSSYTRQWIIWHVIEHDVHHGGEVSFALGMHGVPAIDL
jgi:uncharacterized damage-inducible protein DinB